MSKDPIAQRATDPATSAWVSANAGAGKTQMLANRVTRLLLSGAAPDRILCLTFTKAAAAEMSARLFRDLGRWSLLPDDELRKALTDIGAGDVAPEQLARARRLFAQALETPGGLKIQTIHSFCQLILSRFPIEAGVPPRFQVLDERSADEIMRAARSAILQRAEIDARFAEAAAIVASRADDVRFGELLDLGIKGRGNVADLVGKQGGETQFFAHLRRNLGAPAGDERSLLSNFCDEFGGDRETCKQAVAWLLSGSKTDQDKGRSLDAFLGCADGPDGMHHLRKVFLTQDGSPRATLVTKGTAKTNAALHDYLLRLADRVHKLEEQRRAVRVAVVTEAIVTLSLAVMEEYGRLKRVRAALDYDDLILLTRGLLLRSDMAQWVLYKLDNGIAHILVDEAQDTSRDQWQIVRQLADEFFAGEGAQAKQRTLFAVGDEKQSIFGFQGAAPKEFGVNRTHFLGLARNAGMPFEDAHPAVSRRSGQAILKFVDAVFAQPDARKGLTFADEEVRHAADRSEIGRVEIWPSVPVPDNVEVDPWEDPVDAPARRGAHVRLAQLIAGRIKALLDGGARVPSTGKPVTPGSIMILVRRRNAFATEMIRQLLERRIPVAGADRMVLTEQMAIQDLLALGRFVLLPDDELNLAALLKAPFLDLSEDDLFELAYERKAKLWAVLTKRKDERLAFARAHAFLSDALRAADFVPPFEFYARILGKDVRRMIVARLGDEAADAVDEFLALALAHEGMHAPSLESFLDWFEKGASDVKRDMERAGNAVRVMTVHGAKGLEADIVIVPDTTQIPEQEKRAPLLYTDDCVYFNVAQALEVQAITDAKALLQERAMEEYRRLLYVALTRARDWLIVAGYQMLKTPVHNESWYRAVADAAEHLGEKDVDGVIAFGDPVTTGDVQRAIPAAALSLPSFLRTAAPKEPARARVFRPSDAAGAEEPALLSPLADNGRRFRRGLLIHALLAALPNVAREKSDEAARRYLERERVEEGDIDAIVKEALAVLHHPQFAAVFAEGSRAEVPIVAELPEIGAGVRISGQIDRLAVTADSVLIADFKTNRPPPATPEKTSAVYLAQMALYRAALQKIYLDRRVSCALIWTDGARLMPLPDALLDAELVKITQRTLDLAAT